MPTSRILTGGGGIKWGLIVLNRYSRRFLRFRLSMVTRRGSVFIQWGVIGKMAELSYRGGSMKIWVKDEVKDITRVVFDHPIWRVKIGDPVPDMPLDVQIELTNTCNLGCEACSYKDSKRKKEFLEWNTLKNIVDEAANESTAYFTICGIGEAALHPDLFRFFKYVRSKTVKPKGLRTLEAMLTVLISNGCWTDNQVQECIENPPDLLSFSLAGLTDEEIKKRRAPLDLDRFIGNVSKIYHGRKLKRKIDGGVSPVIHISTHIFPHEMRERADDIEKFKEKFFQISDAIVVKPTELDLRFTPYEQFLEDHMDISEVHYKRTSPCFETSRRLSITSNGDVWCGHHLPEDFGPILGNIKNQSIREIWHSEKMNEFRLDARAGIFSRSCCQTCGGEIREENKTPNEREANICFVSH